MNKANIFLASSVLTFLFMPATLSGQNKMMFGDTSRTGTPFSKDPHVIKFAGRYLMYYSIRPYKDISNPVKGLGIGIAESTDLVNWGKCGEITPAADYESKGLCAPCARVIDGKVHLFYQTYGNGKDDAICHAVSTDGISFTRDTSNPVFRPEGAWTCGRAIDAEVIKFKGNYYLYYATRDPGYKIQMQGVAMAPGNSDFSRSTWKNLSVTEPMLKPELPWEKDCIEGASVIERKGKLYMFYAGAYNNAPQQIGVAVSSDGVSWKRMSVEPFLANGNEGEWNSSESGHPHIFEDEDGRTYLFFQGNSDKGKTWFISNTEVKWNKSGPYISGPGLTGKSSMVKVQFRESDSIFANPGQGWMSSRLPSSIKYIRIGWADLEPERGKYNWSAIDNAIEAGKKKGIKVSLRIMTTSPHSRGYYTSPKWLFDEGCKSFEYLEGGDDPTKGGVRIQRIEPDYSDTLYLFRHAEFIGALGQRYDAGGDLEFLDIGSYGYWGEWHTPHPVSVEIRKKIVDMYTAAFKKTPLVFMTDDAEVLKYALKSGTGMRRDGVGSRWHEQSWIGSAKYAGVEGMADVWKRSPIVFEWYGNYDYLLKRGWSFDSAVIFMLKNHVTIINDNVGNVPEDKMPQIDKLSRLAGARFVLSEIEHDRVVKGNDLLTVKMKWTNSGVGKIYKSYILKLFLLDKNDRIIFTGDAKADLQTWLPGEHDISQLFFIPGSVKKGDYKMAVAIVSQAVNQPSFRLAIDVPQKDGMYLVSRLTIK